MVMEKRFSYLVALVIGLVLVFALIFIFWIRKTTLQVEALKNEKTELIAAKSNLTKQATSLKDEIVGRDRKIKDLQAQVHELGGLKNKLEQEYSTKAGEASVYKNKTAEQAANIGRLEKRIAEMETSFQTKISHRDQVIGNLRDESQEVIQLKEDIERQYRAKVDEASEYKNKTAEQAANIVRLEKRLAEMEASFSAIRTEREKTIADLTQRQQQLLNQVNQIDGDRTELSRIMESHKTDAVRYKTRAGKLSKANEDLEQRIKGLSTEIEGIQAHTEQLAKQKTQLAQRVTEIEARAGELEEAGRKAERTVQIQEELIESLREEIAAGQVKIAQLTSRTTVRLKDRIFFDSGKASVKASGLAILRKIGQTLKNIQDKHIQVEGHTDMRPIITELREKYPTNWELSVARASTIVRYLIDVVKIDPDRISAVGYAFYKPLAPNDTPEGQQENRRVEFALLPPRDPAP
jgi:chemotaxis protein MotB